MCVKRVGVFALAVLGLGAVLWAVFGPNLAGGPNRTEAQQAGKAKVGKYEFISAGLVTALMIDSETGKTYALASAAGDRLGGVGVGGPEFAWVPISKFDNINDFREWLQEQRQQLRRRVEEEFGRKDKPPLDKKIEAPKDRFRDRNEEFKDKFEEKAKDKFEEKKELDKQVGQVKPQAIHVQAFHDKAGNLMVRVEGQLVQVSRNDRTLDAKKFRNALRPYVGGRQTEPELILEVSGDLTWGTVLAMQDAAKAAGVRVRGMRLNPTDQQLTGRIRIPPQARFGLLFGESAPSLVPIYRMATVSAVVSQPSQARR